VGKLNRSRGERGFVLLDVLAALAIALLGLTVFIGSLAGAGRIAIAQADRVVRTIEQRNADAETRVVTFPAE